MRKLVLLVAAALVVSAPMLATSSTDSFAAAKAKKKAAASQQDRSLFEAFADQLGGAGTADASAGKKKGRTAARKKRAN